MRERIYRMVQRRVRRVDCIQDVVTKDGKNLRVKTLFVLIKRVNTSTKDLTRKRVKEAMAKTASENNLDDFIRMIIKGDLQKAVRKGVSKLYPIGDLEVRKSEVRL